MSNTYLQVRTNQTDKEQASEILESLGTNISTVVNMLLKQIIMTKGIPFEIKMNKAYEDKEEIAEVKATLEIEDLNLSEEDLSFLTQYQKATPEERESLRQLTLATLDNYE